jgi:hypothetical protein
MSKQLLKKIQNGEFGIETLKSVKTLEASVIKKIWVILDKKKRGVKISPLVALNFLSDGWALGIIISKHQELAKEWQDMDSAEIQSLNAHFAAELGMENEKAALVAQATSELSIQIAKYIELMSSVMK